MKVIEFNNGLWIEYPDINVKVANYLRNNLERYDESIGLTKEEFIEDLIKNVT